MSSRRVPPPPTRYGPQAVASPKLGRPEIFRFVPRHMPPPHGRIIQPAAAGGDDQRPSEEFRKNAAIVNGQAEGAQNATIKVILVNVATNSRHAFDDSHIYPQQGPHSEAVVTERALQWIKGLGAPAGNLRVASVQMSSRFNPCVGCAPAICTFKDNVLALASNGAPGRFMIAYTDRVYCKPGDPLEQSVANRAQGAAQMRQAGWHVTEGFG
jgi:hypothetical protein